MAAVYLGPWFQLDKSTLNEHHHQGNYRLQTSLDDVEHSPKQIRKREDEKEFQRFPVILRQEAERPRKKYLNCSIVFRGRHIRRQPDRQAVRRTVRPAHCSTGAISISFGGFFSRVSLAPLRAIRSDLLRLHSFR